MNITGPISHQYPASDASSIAAEGIRGQLTRLDQNAAVVAHGQGSDSLTSGSRDLALVEQSEIVRAVRANARSLEASSQAIGTILDIKV